MPFVFVYITTKDREEAETLGRMLIENDLAACVNILPGLTSMYRWEGKVQKTQETVVIAKTGEHLFHNLMDAIRETHSSDIPCIIKLPITGGNPDFFEWMRTILPQQLD